MTPEDFPEANRTLTWEGPPLRVWTNEHYCISRWRMSWRERLSALFLGRVWLSMLSGGTQPPVSLSAERSVFLVPPVAEETGAYEKAPIGETP